jgi:ubiquitin-conjugating enzyme E2 D/E
MTIKRIQREISDLKKENLGDIVLEPTENLQVWKGVIPGPQGSVYEGGTFRVEIQLPNDYPFVLLFSVLGCLLYQHCIF